MIFSRLHSFFKVLSQIHNFVLCKFYVKCDVIAKCLFMTMNPKYLFYERSKVLNESQFSLHKNVFPLIKRVKHLSEFSDFLLLEVLVIYLS